MGTLLIFLDGVGVGRDDRTVNPFARVDARRLSVVAGRSPDPAASFRALDARLGVEGLPQSATNQTTLYTGVNAARVLGRHMTGVPGPTLVRVIERESVFLKLARAGRRPTFANAYSRGHLEAERPRWSATTRMVMASGLPFRMIDREESAGAALFHDYTGEWARRRDLPVTPRSAAEAARVLARLTAEQDVTLYEYFLTDLAGHRGGTEDRLEQARRVEALVDAVLAEVDLDRHRVVVFSDHGNLEEADHGLHTQNPVPLLAWGRGAAGLVDRVDGLTGLTPALVEDGG